MTRRRTAALSVLAALALLAASCGDDNGSSTEPDPESTADPFADPANAEPVYEGRGFHPVGVTTLTLGDETPVEVYYPGDPAVDATPAEYRTDDALPPELVAIVPPDLDLAVAIDGFRDIPASPDGPFPVLLFSHGVGAYRNYYSNLLAGIASHGVVVASTDYLDRGLAALALGLGTDTEELTDEEIETAREERRAAERETMLATLDLVLAESDDPSSLLAGSADADRVGAAGHSAGVGTIAAASDDPRVVAAVGWAGGSTGFDPDTATMVLFAERDPGATPEEGTEAYEELTAPRALGIIAEAGHASFTDFCRNQQAGVDLIDVALGLGFPIPESLVELGYNGCRPEDVPPEDVWPIIQHFTVAWLLHQTGVNAEPVGLGDAVAETFPVAVDYRHDP